MWHVVRRMVGRYKELILSATFFGMASYEAAEMWMLEGRRPPSLPLAVLVHSLQVAVILAATALAVRAWQRKTAHEEALSRLVEWVVFAQEDGRRRIAYEAHGGMWTLV